MLYAEAHFGCLGRLKDENLQAVIRNQAVMAAALAAGLLCLQTARADLLQDFADAVAAQAAAAAKGSDPRNIPAHAAKGVMRPPHGRLVAIDDKPMMLAPGSKIRDLDNRIVMPSTITAPVNVRYTVDQYAHVHHIWLMPGKVESEKKNQGNNAEN